MGAGPLAAPTVPIRHLGSRALATSCLRLVLGPWALERLIRYSLDTVPPGPFPYGWPPPGGQFTPLYQ